MKLDKASMVDLLVAYWRGDLPAGDEESRLACRQMVADLAASMSALELMAWQEEPDRHRRDIDERVAVWLAGRSASRDMAQAPVRPPTPRPEPAAPPDAPEAAPAPPPPTGRGGATHVEQHVQGGVAFGILDSVQGGINLTLPGSIGSGSARPEARSDAAPVDRIVRILFLGANPSDSTRLRLDEEVRAIDHALTSAELGSRCELCQKWAVRASELQGYLLRTKPRVLHFSGHGGRDSGIFLEAEDGSSRPLAAARLANLLRQFNERLRCVVLNACYSAEQADAIAEHIDCVVGMSAAVADRAAIPFAAAFYRAVASGCSVRAAFDQACADIEVGELDQADVPRLVAPRCDPAKLVLVRTD